MGEDSLTVLQSRLSERSGRPGFFYIRNRTNHIFHTFWVNGVIDDPCQRRRMIIIVATAVDYKPSIHKAMIGEKAFTVRNLTPVFATDDQRKDTKSKIENNLYGIFHKYMEQRS